MIIKIKMYFDRVSFNRIQLNVVGIKDVLSLADIGISKRIVFAFHHVADYVTFKA